MTASNPFPPETLIISIVLVAMNEYQTSSSGDVPAKEQEGMFREAVALKVCVPVVKMVGEVTGKEIAFEQLSLIGGAGVALTHIPNWPLPVPDPT